MFTIIRLALLGCLCAYIFSITPFAETSLPMPEIASGTQSESILPDLEEDTVKEFLAEIPNFCSNYAKFCEFGDSALHIAHVQAVSLTGALHDWLADGLDKG